MRFFFIFRSLGVLTELRLLGFSNIFFKDAMSLLRHYKEAMQRDVNEKVGCRDGQPIILSRNSVTRFFLGQVMKIKILRFLF